MRRVRTLHILSIASACGGLVGIGAGLADGVGRHGGVALVGIAGGAGWLVASAACGLAAAGIYRRGCRRMARDLLAARATLPAAPAGGTVAPADGVDDELFPLAEAAIKLVAAAGEKVGEAAARALEAEFRLDLAAAERQHARAILYSITDAVVVTDGADEVVLANEAAARTFQFDPARVGHAPVDELVRDRQIVQLVRDMRESRHGLGQRVVEHQLDTPAGRRTFKITLSPAGGGAAAPGDAGGVVLVLHDVSRQKDVAEMKNDFASLVSHELRTPLASIQAYVEMLIDGEATDARTTRAFYDVIQNEADRLSRLIDNTLELSRIESGLARCHRRPLDLGGVLAGAAAAVAPAAAAKGVHLVEQFAAGVAVSADAELLARAALNLLGNAVKFTPPGGTVTVRTAVDPAAGKVITRVADTGVGISPRDLPFVFDKFYRGDDAQPPGPQGTGLGLALTKRIIETVHGGRLFVESRAGQGSCFGFELDVCEKEVVSAEC